MGKTHRLQIEQIVAYYLTKIKAFYEKSGIMSNEFVISVPSYFTNVERQALIDASEIAGLKCLRLINESTAIAYNYGFFRKNDLDEKKERVVAFVDMGHSKTTVSIAAFKKGECKIICHNSDRNMGGRNLDYQVMQVVGEEFAKKYGDDPRKIARCRVRMLEAVEKARKLLSSDHESTVNADYLLNEEDLVRKLKRDEYEQIIEPIVKKFADLLKETLEKANITADKVDFVEMVGDTTRTPIILEVTKEIFQKQELQRTLNSIETVARGAALNCAMNTPSFSVQPFKMTDYNSVPVKVSCNFENDTDGKQNVFPNFFKAGQKFPISFDIKFDNKEGDLTVAVDYDQNAPILAGLPHTISQHKIGKGTRQKADQPDSKCRVDIRVLNNISGIPQLQGVWLVENWTEEEKIPIKTAPKPTPPAAASTDKKEGEEDKKEVP